MARSGRPKESRAREQAQRPAPLPPETRTVGQLVAESIRLYGRRFWRSLALGAGPAIVGVSSSFLGRTPAIALLTAAGALAMAVSYVGASLIVSEKRPTRRTLAVATAAGFVVYLPVPYLTLLLVLPAVAWLAFFGLAVPAAVIEGLGLRAAFRRGIELGKADFVHAAGSLAALVVVVFLTGSIMSVLLHGGSGQAVRVAAFLASFVVTPLLFLGAALLYYDQAARVTSSPPETRSVSSPGFRRKKEA